MLKNSVFIPLFQKELINNILDTRQEISLHLTRTLDIMNTKKENTDIEIKTILKEFKIKRFHYFSKEGKLIYSTQKGQNYCFSYYRDIYSVWRFIF